MSDPGFEILEGVIAARDCDALAAALADGRAPSSRAGRRHLMAHPEVRRLVQDPKLLDIARGWVGPGATPYRATLFEKSGQRNWLVVWHQDTTLPLSARIDSPEWGPWSIKDSILYAQAPTRALTGIVALRIHLDASTALNGPLRVLPGSHREGVLTDDAVFRKAREGFPVDCLAGRGSVLAMRPLLIHASSKARGPEPRRVLHVEYAASLDLGNGLQLVPA